MELASKYNPADVEGKWYQYWLDHKLFSSKPDGREPYTVVIPPPNVTGVLHMGHMLNNTIQDILVRRARMEGKNACWVPGTDHASIATEAKVVNKLAAAVKAVSGVSARPVGIGGGTVGAYLRKAGFQAVVWSRMDETAHQPNEYTVINNIIHDAQVLAYIMMNP